MAWGITAKELLEIYGAGERNFTGVELIEDKTPDSRDCASEIYGLEGADLRGINLCGANLQGVVLEVTNLSEANLFGACLCAADLSYAVLKRADLRSINLMGASCKGANFTGANMSLINATQTGFIDAQIVGAFLENAILVCASFKGSDTYKRAICQCGNLIYNTTMPDGTIESDFYWGHW